MGYSAVYPKGAGFVRFVHTEDAQRAIEGIRTAQIKLEGGKGPLEVKLADRQKPAEDQTRWVLF